MATMNVSLPDAMKQWIEEQIATGRYANVSDYIRDLIRHEQAVHDKRELLVKALIEGENSGYVDYSIADVIEELDAEIAGEHTSE